MREGEISKQGEVSNKQEDSTQITGEEANEAEVASISKDLIQSRLSQQTHSSYQ